MPTTEEVLFLNKTAIALLQRGKPEACLERLQAAEAVLKCLGLPHSHNLWGTTLNNYGCYYKRLGKFTLALHFFEGALIAQPSTPDHVLVKAGVLLNLCSLKSQLRKENQVVLHAQQLLALATPHLPAEPRLAKCVALAQQYLAPKCPALGSTVSQKRCVSKRRPVLTTHSPNARTTDRVRVLPRLTPRGKTLKRRLVTPVFPQTLPKLAKPGGVPAAKRVAAWVRSRLAVKWLARMKQATLVIQRWVRELKLRLYSRT